MTRPVVDGLLLRVVFGVVNVPFKVGPLAWRRCLGLLMRRVDVGGINEALTARQRRLYRRICGKKGWGYFGAGGPNPVVWKRTKYRYVDGDLHQLHPRATGRRARLFRGFNAARYVTEVVLASKATGVEIAVLCFHLAPGGPRVSRTWRRQAIAQSISVLEQLVAKHTAAGRPVLPIGDTNLRTLQVAGVTWLNDEDIDKAGVALPDDDELVAERDGVFPAPTDHRRGIYAAARIRIRPRTHIRSAA